MARPEGQISISDPLSLVTEAISARLQLFAKMREIERQTGQINLRIAEQELAWVEIALELVRQFLRPTNYK